MTRLSLREAAGRTSRSISTLRRYIRSGRLRAEKRAGRYGPEYVVADGDLVEAGLRPRGVEGPLDLHELRNVAVHAPARTAPEIVPLSLYQELQMKHELLLVQYGMVRAGGLKLLELKAQLDAERGRSAQAAAEVQRAGHEISRLAQRLREAELDIEGKRLEIAALEEKVRALEMLSRNARTTETIEHQFARLVGQARKVHRMVAGGEPGPAGPGTDH
jgi:hypothetical protein